MPVEMLKSKQAGKGERGILSFCDLCSEILTLFCSGFVFFVCCNLPLLVASSVLFFHIVFYCIVSSRIYYIG